MPTAVRRIQGASGLSSTTVGCAVAERREHIKHIKIKITAVWLPRYSREETHQSMVSLKAVALTADRSTSQVSLQQSKKQSVSRVAVMSLSYELTVYLEACIDSGKDGAESAANREVV